MPSRDPRIDDYIAKAKPFAQEILIHIRERVHLLCPEVDETIKWGFPHFEYKNELLCSMAAFKEHCAFGFWKAALLTDPVLSENRDAAMGHLGKLKSIHDLPPNFDKLVKEAMSFNEQGIKVPKKPAANRKEYLMPPEFEQALRENHHAWEVFDKFSYSHRKEYIEWIVEAKTEATRNKRIAQAIEWLKEGKERNWKYARSKS
jgi:uncharacterized protein YdeI (YjbR/CyaY-like superfamily)